MGRQLLPLYDIFSTVHYPELSRDMAMKIGGEYSSEKVTPKNFEELAEEAGLGKPLVKRRVSELADIVIDAIPRVMIAHPAAAKIGARIRQRAEGMRR
jgi:serine/threonine-protein kinase HipA